MVLEKASIKENIDSQQKSPEKLASQKFDSIFNRIKNSTEALYSFGKERNQEIRTRLSAGNGSFGRFINIQKTVNGVSSDYKLSYNGNKFTLTAGPIGSPQKIVNPTFEQILNDVLPNFEIRLHEAETYNVQEKQKIIQEANQYAYQQDQQDANKLLQENGLA